MPLSIPFGATSGYASVALGWMAKQAGMSDEVAAAIVAASLLPQWLKFLWAPLCDVVSTRKRWYLVSNLLSSLTLAAVGLVPFRPDMLWLIKALVVANSIAMTFNGMSVQALMAEATPPAKLGQAGGWHQAGNLGGQGLGGGLALLVSEHFSPGTASLVTGAVLFASTFFLLAVPEGPRPGMPAHRRLATLLAGFYLLIRPYIKRGAWMRSAIPAVCAGESCLLFLPIGRLPLKVGEIAVYYRVLNLRCST